MLHKATGTFLVHFDAATVTCHISKQRHKAPSDRPGPGLSTRSLYRTPALLPLLHRLRLLGSGRRRVLLLLRRRRCLLLRERGGEAAWRSRRLLLLLVVALVLGAGLWLVHHDRHVLALVPGVISQGVVVVAVVVMVVAGTITTYTFLEK